MNTTPNGPLAASIDVSATVNTASINCSVSYFAFSALHVSSSTNDRRCRPSAIRTSTSSNAVPVTVGDVRRAMSADVSPAEFEYLAQR